MAYVEILTSHDLTAEQWDDQIFESYIGQLWWKHLMGESASSVIQVREDLTKAAGDAITVGLRSQLKGGKVTGNARGLGNEGSVDFFGQRITIDNVRHLVKVTDTSMSVRRVNFDLLRAVRDALEEKAQEDLDDSITTALTDTSIGRTRGKYLYGRSDANWNASHAVALQNVDSTNDKLTVKIVSAAKRKALKASGSNLAKRKIRPFRLKNGQNFEQWYIFVAPPVAIRDLHESDADFKSWSQLLLPRDPESPIFQGTALKGAWDGVLIYEYDRMPLLAGAGTDGIQVAHCLLLGAQAAAVVWGQRAKFGEEEQDLGHEISYEIHEIRGHSKLVFDGEDEGVVNVFVSGVAD